ncbi:mechanosensitive ion channel family protein [Alkalimarinus alittae]|uniref:Small-conductance mechanosensitive channel n=1 Tax=Alkalimarinus alittae TaxID=2961619 RepID=A0ABY6N340_9ALTE|nr:mechanosensitive ion channel family protein [Alkalimarinus alittae]UZE96509.1 mechanosensitive ion channel family protein [Alkalimarinus alittae]
MMEKQPPSTSESIQLMWGTLVDIWRDVLSHIPLLIIGFVILFLTWLASKLVNIVLHKTLKGKRIKRGLADLTRQLITVLIWLFGITVTAVVIFPGMTPAKVLAGLGIGSVALGFAFKDIVENFLAGILILWKFPFDPGDFIIVDGTVGRIEEVSVRMTILRKTTGELVVIPNARLFKGQVEVLTSTPIRRITVICGIAYSEDIDEARSVIDRAVNSCESVSQQRPTEVFAQEFADSSINFEITWWCGSTPLDVRKSKDQVVAAVKKALDNASIEIPFPHRTLTFPQPRILQREEEINTGEEG